MLNRKRYVLAIAVVAVAIAGAACSDDGTTTTTGDAPSAVSSADDVVFGSGELPATIPAAFQLPAGSAIGTTMVVTKTGFTEVVVRVSADVGVTAEFFNQALAQGGFSVDSSIADGNGWLIEFSDDNARGTVDLTQALEGVSQAVVRYNVP